jgi:hypothetical protein
MRIKVSIAIFGLNKDHYILYLNPIVPKKIPHNSKYKVIKADPLT